MHSLLVGIFDPACELFPPSDEETPLVYSCVLLPLYLLSDLPTPLPKVNVHYKQTVYGCRGGGGGERVLSCVVYHILQEFNTVSEHTKLLHHPKQK
jgi:hypothetical protein